MRKYKYYYIGLFGIIFSYTASVAYRRYKRRFQKRIGTQGWKISHTSGIQLVDLGLPSGTLWADRNIGADAPEQSGDYFRFGETVPFTEDSPKFYVGVKKNIAGTYMDAATVILGKGYKMPTQEQVKELFKECKWEWTAMNGVNGMKVTGPNGNHIFFPASGCRNCDDGSLHGVGSYGYCWFASANLSTNTHYLYFDSSRWGWGDRYRADGYSVRAVAVKNMK